MGRRLGPASDDAQVRDQASFDVVTAIEVVEHIPVEFETMRQIAALVKPGGVFFLTTGNAAVHRDSFTKWAYVHPDIHVAYFEPRTSEAYRRARSEPVALPGHEGVHHPYKRPEDAVRDVAQPLRAPRSLADRQPVVDRRYKLSEQPLARKPAR